MNWKFLPFTRVRVAAPRDQRLPARGATPAIGIPVAISLIEAVDLEEEFEHERNDEQRSAAPKYAQEGAPGPRRVEMTLIPGGGTQDLAFGELRSDVRTPNTFGWAGNLVLFPAGPV